MSMLVLAAAALATTPRLCADGAAPTVDEQAAINTQAAAAVAMGYQPEVSSFFEDMADSLLGLFNVRHTGNSWERIALAASVLVLFYLFRRIALPIFFRLLHRGAKRSGFSLVDGVVNALEAPLALFIMTGGVYVSLNMLRHSAATTDALKLGAKVLFAITFLWLLLRLVDALLKFLEDKAAAKASPIATFMPWIRKAALGIFFVFGLLTILQSLGINVQAFIAGLGIGGLAFALAAQDTVANVFGAAVVAIDQPFKIGEVVQIGAHTGAVEDIGVRSMKLRRADKSLVVIPNKTVASESIVNLSKFTNRRVEQTLGFTYESTPAQLAAMVEDIKRLINDDPDVLAESTMVYFRDFGASSLDLWVVYITKEPDFQKHMALRQRLNLAIMQTAADRGLSFAFPTQTIDLAPSAAKALGKA